MSKFALLVAIAAIAAGAFYLGRHPTVAAVPQQQAVPVVDDPFANLEPNPCPHGYLPNPNTPGDCIPAPGFVFVQQQPAQADTSGQLRQIQETQHAMQVEQREAAFEAQQAAIEAQNDQRTQALIQGIKP